MWSQWLGSLLASLLVTWLALLVALWILKPDQRRLSEAVRLLPDVIRLITRLARDETIPIRVRARLWAVLGYLAFPIDLVTDFITIIGYADDAIIVTITLRSVVRKAGIDKVAEHWPGTPEGLDSLRRLTRI